MKIVSVYEGSLIVEYALFVPNDDPVQLSALKDKHIQLMATD